MSTSNPVTNASDFLRGQQDCQKGKPHQSGQGPDYDRGYETEYVFQEVMSARTAYQESRCGYR